MLKIHSLLNPSTSDDRFDCSRATSPPPTPAYTANEYSPASTPRPDTPPTPSPTKRQKLIKDAAVFQRGAVKAPINYPPFECNEDSLCLSSDQRVELAAQHRRFQVFPSGHGNEDLISDFVRHIPYSSEKKSFLNKTGRDAFDVFQYTFIIPGDPDNRTHVVMWDYQIGLVRITPFFKACKYSKTTPAKALTTNSGLKALSHSITGGALAAQGYWMPYACARAICLTFCYNIRWALSPIFGPSFIKECLPPENSGFARFKIDAEVIRCATLEAEGWKNSVASQTSTPMISGTGQQIPRSAPVDPVLNTHLQLWQRRPDFMVGSPFDSDVGHSVHHNYTYMPPPFESPELSPRSQQQAIEVVPAWTSINRSQHDEPPPPPHSAPIRSLASSLLAEPRHSPATSWRAAEAPAPEPQELRNPPRTAHRHSVTSFSKDVTDAPNPAPATNDSQPSSSEDDTPMASTRAMKKRKRSAAGKETHKANKVKKTANNGPTKFTAADARAAHWLLQLSVRDSQLAASSKSISSRKQVESGA
ncbi:hypothetical protein DOTSEDRAFT_51684 [Dothistroma septosporum NZE10]|uniref:HTH APSES-type domain-containing protein n=1 Tax=Dothistroma septosporum (strain NZE10 / CBS 128990) TaxID=675120 RepID=N1PUU9_DOTSN|nr:hypothetical protein DOTSEDRAFT_51684 [Dothistroma septosporum NZE10]